VKDDQTVRWQWERNRRSRALDTESALVGALTMIGRSVTVDRNYLSVQLDNQWSRYSQGAGSSREPFEALEATASMVVARWAMRPLPVAPSALLAAVGAKSHEGLAVHLLAHVLFASGIEVDLIDFTARAWVNLSEGRFL
jgi:hypothetical protein